MDSDNILDGLVRIGKVTARRSSDHSVRVKFEDEDTTSGWLPVLQHGSDWMPGIITTVLVLYLPLWNADGYVLGAIT